MLDSGKGSKGLKGMFTHRHQVQFYETDLMGIVHHSNYLRFCEEARVAWAQERGLIDYQRPESAAHFAVLETHVRHLRPAIFGDVIEVELQVRREGVRIQFQYLLKRGSDRLAAVETVHVPLGKDLKPLRVPEAMKDVLEKEQWIETWLSSS